MKSFSKVRDDDDRKDIDLFIKDTRSQFKKRNKKSKRLKWTADAKCIYKKKIHNSFWTKSCLKNLSRNRKSWSWRCSLLPPLPLLLLHFICLLFIFLHLLLVAYYSLSVLIFSSYLTHFTLSICIYLFIK